MVDLYRELLRVIRALDDASVVYALAGGLAVSIYSAPRATEDVDLVVDARDITRAVEVLGPLGLVLPGGPCARLVGGSRSSG